MPDKPVATTPLMKQHHQMKLRYPDAILLFRVGDFYETFGQDAVDTSHILNITLTKRNNGIAESTALAGFPYHALDTYLHKLIKAGRRVAICDQLENPQTAKGLVKRGVTEIVTPGVTVNDKILSATDNNYLAALYITKHEWGLALVDVSTASFYVAEGGIDFVKKLLFSFSPSEIILAKSQLPNFQELIGKNFYTYTLEDWMFEFAFNKDAIINHFGIHHSMKGFGLQDMNNAIIAAGVIIQYLKETKHPNITYLQHIQKIYPEKHLWMDNFTFKNLEIISGQFPLISVLDATKTPMGSRLLKQWIRMPLIDKQAIDDRLSLTQLFATNPELSENLLTCLQGMGDVERTINKVPTRKINPRELLHLAKALRLWSQVRTLLHTHNVPYLQSLLSDLDDHIVLQTNISEWLEEEPPLQIGKSPLIKNAVHQELDELRYLLHSNKESILAIQQQAIEETGITALKVGFNNIFGYYLEVSNTHKTKVPATWIRKQTLANAERYITQELKIFEDKVLNAQEKILAIEQSMFERLLSIVDEHVQTILKGCKIIATLDVLQGFAYIANEYNYKKPIITEGHELILLDSRHPVIERYMLKSGEQYIANDIKLNQDTQQILLITGPNMSGKSAVLRQTALNTLMAHIGSFVACSEASIPITDKIFTRVGASDNLAQGESTFMLEMNETASILNNISPRSLILLDEIGRGTATYDGVSIAWGIVEYLSLHTSRPKTLFSTHYHELVAIEKSLTNVRNFHISNRQENNKIIFLRKLVAGGSTHSFGLHVAQMAGIPASVIKRANEILHTLEERENRDQLAKNLAKIATSSSTHQATLSFHNEEKFKKIKQFLETLEINRMTPVEALMKIQELKTML